ncbi:dihydrofolate reductase [Candidatus Nanohalococcus occultus]|uniref:dihydrofolate reductase n=1 Tax=Candidatus Nanohalococcus occultus TaxID=2978047 RepID=A0ABY8CD97_9ARCH|nr:Dihydrofolate reductase [Candidatus Nanohaloarchaeota archaeon SVXNc]
MKKVIIAAVSENRAIGKDGEIPWQIPEDLKHFKEKTTGHPVIMGRKTFESLPESHRPLPGRTNIVLSRSGFDHTKESVRSANSLDEAYQIADELAEKAFVIGGASVYRQALKDADRMILTEIHERYEGDTFFPEFEDGNWREVRRDEREGFDFVKYRKHC